MPYPDSVRGPSLNQVAWYTLLAVVALTPLAVVPAWRPEWAAVVHSYILPQNAVLTYGVALVAILWAADCARGRRAMLLSRTAIPLLVFLGWAAISTLNAYDPARSALGSTVSSLPLARLVIYAGLGGLLYQLLNSPARLRVLTQAVIVSAAVVALLALIEQGFHVSPLGFTSTPRWMLDRGTATLGNPDFLGTFLVAPTVLALISSIFERGRAWRQVHTICLFILSAATIGTLTRGAWLGLLTGVAITFALLGYAGRDRHTRRRMMVAAAVLVCALAVPVINGNAAGVLSRFSANPGAGREATTLAEKTNAITSGRVDIWHAALMTIAERPLTGTGPDTFEFGWFAHAQRPTSVGGSNDVERDPHSLPLFIAATTGVPGLLAAVVFAGWTVAEAMRRAWASRRKLDALIGAPLHAAWLSAALAILTALLVGAVTPPIMLQLSVILAVLSRTSVRPQSMTLTRPRLIASVTAIGLMLLGPAIAIGPQIAAERALAATAASGDFVRSTPAVARVRWDIDAQRTYFRLRAARVSQAVSAKAPAAPAEVQQLVAELYEVEAALPHELYYPALRAQVLAEASGGLGDPEYASEAINAADRALGIMTASIPVRVSKALALGDLGRFGEMHETLAGWWRNETVSPLPGLLYAQALMLDGREDAGWQVLGELEAFFPHDESLEDGRRLLEQLTDTE